jgi:Mg2+-importing ATPase
MATVVVFVIALALPYTALGTLLGFTPIPVSFLLVLAIITSSYLVASEVTKKFFYRETEVVE